jgi:uncharacterized protein
MALFTLADLRAQPACLLLDAVSGSRAYGTDLPTSDHDRKGVFALPQAAFFGLNYVPQVANDSNDEVYYELGRWVELLLKNNPTALEILASPPDCVFVRSPVLAALRPELFLSKLCRQTFAEFAATQVRKARGLNKKISQPLEPVRKSVLDFCYVTVGAGAQSLADWLHRHGLTQQQLGLANVPHVTDIYALFADTSATGALGYRGIIRDPDTANEVLLTAIPKGETPVAYLSFNRNGYSTYCRVYKEYWAWVAKRNAERYDNTIRHGQGYDAKNMLHVFRVLEMAEEIAQYGELRVRRPNRDFLLTIRRGEFAYDDLLPRAEDLLARVDAAFAASALPDEPDYAAAEATLIQIRRRLYSDE